MAVCDLTVKACLLCIDVNILRHMSTGQISQAQLSELNAKQRVLLKQALKCEYNRLSDRVSIIVLFITVYLFYCATHYIKARYVTMSICPISVTLVVCVKTAERIELVFGTDATLI